MSSYSLMKKHTFITHTQLLEAICMEIGIERKLIICDHARKQKGLKFI
jgi:hypothetical protein